MFLWRLLKHPDWDWLTIRDRIAYLVSLAFFLGLMGIGASAVFHWGAHH